MQNNNMMNPNNNFQNMNNRGFNNINQNPNMFNNQKSAGPAFNLNNNIYNNMNMNINNKPFPNNNMPMQFQNNQKMNNMNNIQMQNQNMNNLQMQNKMKPNMNNMMNFNNNNLNNNMSMNNKGMSNSANNMNFQMNMNNVNVNNNKMKNPMNNQNNINFMNLNQKNMNINNQMNNMNNKNITNNNMNNMNNQNNNNNNMSNFSINTNFLNNMNNQNMQQNNNFQQIENQLLSILKSNLQDNILQTLQNEFQILTYFSSCEKKCLDFINLNMINKYMYREHIFQELTNKFNLSPFLNHNLTNQINAKLKNAPLGTFSSRQDYFNYLRNIFGNVEIPKFLIIRDLEALDGLIQYLNRFNKTTTIINNMKNKFENSNSKLVIDFCEKMKNNTMLLFQGINNRYQLFLLFLCVNQKLFLKKYKDNNKFISFLEWNIDLIRANFGNNINYIDIVNYINQLENQRRGNNVQNQEDIIFNNIAFTLNNNINIISNIISSFYVLLLYKFKNIYNNDAKCNLDNTHLTVAVKNFVIYLNQKCPNYSNNGINLFQLLMDLMTYDVDNLIKFDKFFNEKNISYNFNEIDSMLSDNQRYKELKEANINRYQNDLDDGVFTLIKKNWNNCGYIKDFQLYFKLKPIDKEVLSNSITILIDGADFNTNEDKFNWNDFISKFNGETNFYEMNWPNIVSDLKRKTNKNIRTLKFIAKTCGKLLGYILYSEKFFGNFQINLVGLNFGCYIIKSCLKVLQNLNSQDNKKIFIKNVIFINGAINIRNKMNWSNIFENLIVDKIINCYSREDNINELLKKYGLEIQSIGTQGLSINDVGKNYLKYEHDLTDFEFGKFNYNLSIPASVSFASYNDL